MKKLVIVALAALFVVALTLPAAAIENEFGGYWRTRFFSQNNFTGEDETEAKDVQRIDTRTRLFYTAKFSDNLRFENRFEFNTIWGDDDGGDIGSDGKKDWRVKHSYVDAKTGMVRFKVGMQGLTLQRGFTFDDDASALVIDVTPNEAIHLPFIWIKAYEGSYYAAGKQDNNDFDVDGYIFNPVFFVGKNIKINPSFAYMTSEDAYYYNKAIKNLDAYEVGLSVDADLKPVTLWATLLKQFGDADFQSGAASQDFAGWLWAVGANGQVGPVGLHGQFFWASGDDDASDDSWDQYYSIPGQSYYWAEIMGYGIFDNQVSSGSPADKISNIMAANLGVDFYPVEKMKLSFDVWNASLAEDNAAGNSELGTELDLKLTFPVVEKLNCDLVGAYLFAGDATHDGDNDADPWEVGARLSLAF